MYGCKKILLCWFVSTNAENVDFILALNSGLGDKHVITGVHGLWMVENHSTKKYHTSEDWDGTFGRRRYCKYDMSLISETEQERITNELPDCPLKHTMNLDPDTPLWKHEIENHFGCVEKLTNFEGLKFDPLTYFQHAFYLEERFYNNVGCAAVLKPGQQPVHKRLESLQEELETLEAVLKIPKAKGFKAHKCELCWKWYPDEFDKFKKISEQFLSKEADIQKRRKKLVEDLDKGGADRLWQSLQERAAIERDEMLNNKKRSFHKNIFNEGLLYRVQTEAKEHAIKIKQEINDIERSSEYIESQSPDYKHCLTGEALAEKAMSFGFIFSDDSVVTSKTRGFKSGEFHLKMAWYTEQGWCGFISPFHFLHEVHHTEKISRIEYEKMNIQTTLRNRRMAEKIKVLELPYSKRMKNIVASAQKKLRHIKHETTYGVSVFVALDVVYAACAMGMAYIFDPNF